MEHDEGIGGYPVRLLLHENLQIDSRKRQQCLLIILDLLLDRRELIYTSVSCTFTVCAYRSKLRRQFEQSSYRIHVAGLSRQAPTRKLSLKRRKFLELRDKF